MGVLDLELGSTRGRSPGPHEALQAATLKHPCEADPVWSTGKGSRTPPPPLKSRSSARAQKRDPEVRVKYLSLSPCIYVGCGAKTINTAYPGASPLDGSGDSPRRPPHQLLPAPSTLSFPSLPSTHQPQGRPKHKLSNASAQFQPPWLPPAQRIRAVFFLVFNIFINLARIDLSALSLSLSKCISPHQFLNHSINFHTFMHLLMTLCSLLTVTKYLMPSQALGTVPNAL